MRYENWDCLVFPHELCKVPIQEFKSACHAIQDPEVHHRQQKPLLIPTVTCFIPSLQAGSAFRVSLHCWENPDPSQYIRSLNNNSREGIVFEARIFVDGRLAGSKLFSPTGPWPTIMDTSMELTKQGELELLKFPTFHRELLAQSYWNAGDDFGRIKIIVSEGFARETMSIPFERIKNVVAFSFQHAPLDVLETSAIAWPNAAMWRQVSLVAPYYGQASPRPAFDEEMAAAHSHSPRKIRGNNTMGPPPSFPRPTVLDADPFTESASARPVYHQSNPGTYVGEQFRQPRQASSATEDSSATESSTSSSRFSQLGNRQATVIHHVSDKMQSSFEDSGEEINALFDHPIVPANTPKTLVPNSPSEILIGAAEAMATAHFKIESFSPEASTSGPSKMQEQFPPDFQAFATSNNGSKRQRIVTPASVKSIDDVDQPMASAMRNLSGRASETARRVLGDLENI